MSTILNAALGYLESHPSWPVFPLFSPETAPTPDRAKTPPFKTGVDHAAGASRDIETVRRWFSGKYRRGYWLGMPTGVPSMTIVIDVDAKHDGEAQLEELERALGRLPRLRVVRTRSGGLHLYFRRPVTPFRIAGGQGDRSKLGRLLGRPGVDVRADGGLVVLPPSEGYAWIADEDEPPPELPLMWLGAIVGLGEPRQRSNRGRAYKVNGVPAWALEIIEDASTIGSGSRNDVLFKLGCTLRKVGASESDIRAALERANTMRCTHPLRAAELAKIAGSAARSKQ